MTFSEVRDQARRFAGVTDDSQDAILESCFDAAKQWFENAGVAERDGDDLYTAMVMMLMVWFRTSVGMTGQDAAIPPYIVTSVHQLRQTDEDTAASEEAGGS